MHRWNGQTPTWQLNRMVLRTSLLATSPQTFGLSPAAWRLRNIFDHECMPLIAPKVTIWSVAREGNLEGVQRFVAEGIPVDSRARGDVTPLHEAAEAGHLEMVQWLIEHGADLHARTLRNPGDAGSHTPLHLAVSAGRLDVARLLIE